MLSSIKHRLIFLKQFILHPERIGSLFPSSKNLAGQITRFIPEYSSRKPQCRILEIGAGTGSITKQIMRKMKEGDHLDVIEVDHSFCKILKKKFSRRKEIAIICGSILDWHPDEGYDVIISSLPMNSLSPDIVKRMISIMKSLIKTDGTISYYEYRFLPCVKLLTLLGEKKEQFKQVLAIKDNFYKKYGIASETVFKNFPPARILHFKLKQLQ